MKPGKTIAGAAILFTGMMAALSLRAPAQETTLKTEPTLFQEVYNTTEDGAAPEGRAALSMRVSPNINNDNLRDAIKRVIGKADVTYEIDADVPTDKKVTLKAENIPLYTAINVLIESAGIGCTESRKRTVSDTEKVRLTLEKIHLHFRKAPSAPLGGGPSSWTLNIPNTVFDKTNWANNFYTFQDGKIKEKSADGKVLFNDSINPKEATTYTNKLLDSFKGLSTSTDGWKPMLYNLTSSEERSTFTCPHCKQQVTVIKKHVAPKCPTCGRTFQDDWKFCPVDGTKRPDDPGEWKFCPHCGKAVP